MDSSEFACADTRRRILQTLKTKIELMSSQNAMAIIQEKENPPVRLAVNILEVFIIHRMVASSLLERRLCIPQPLKPDRKSGAGELEKDALQDRLYWIDNQEQRWTFPTCLSTLRSYMDPLRSALRTLRREGKMLAALLELTLRNPEGSCRQPETGSGDSTRVGSVTGEEKDGTARESTASQNDELQNLRETLANAISDLREAQESRNLARDMLDGTRTELQSSIQTHASLRDELRLAQDQLKDERRRCSQLEEELRQAQRQQKAIEGHLASTLSAKATAEIALNTETARRIRAEKTLTSLSKELATMQATLDDCS